MRRKSVSRCLSGRCLAAWTIKRPATLERSQRAWTGIFTCTELVCSSLGEEHTTATVCGRRVRKISGCQLVLGIMLRHVLGFGNIEEFRGVSPLVKIISPDSEFPAHPSHCRIGQKQAGSETQILSWKWGYSSR